MMLVLKKARAVIASTITEPNRTKLYRTRINKAAMVAIISNKKSHISYGSWCQAAAYIDCG